MIKYTGTYIADRDGARFVRVIRSGPKVAPVRVGVSGDEDDHVVVVGNPTQLLSSLQVPLVNGPIVSHIEGDIDDLEAAVVLMKVLRHELLCYGEVSDMADGIEAEVKEKGGGRFDHGIGCYLKGAFDLEEVVENLPAVDGKAL
jgi:hypothetical protein